MSVNIPEAGYGKKVVLTRIKLEINEGEVVAFIGPNGAGKSTLLKVILGIVSNPKGSMMIDGTDYAMMSPEEIVEMGVSFVPQGNMVFTELTVQENLEMGGHFVRNSATRRERMNMVLEYFPDLKDLSKLQAGKLSGGEKQQLALARALISKPKILMLDEPSLGLSPSLVTKAFDTLLEINQKFNTTILLVEQKVREVLRVAGRVYALRMGQVVFVGTPTELQSGETMKKIFFV